MHYPAVTICNEASRSTLADRLLQRVHHLNQKWQLCARAAGSKDEQCGGAEVRVNCVSGGGDVNGDVGDIGGGGAAASLDNRIQTTRRHRRSSNAQLFNVQLDIPVRRTTFIAAAGASPSPSGSGSSTKAAAAAAQPSSDATDVVKLLQSEVLERDLLNVGRRLDEAA